MKAPIKFDYLKPFVTSKGDTIRMNALCTIHGEQLVESEDRIRFRLNELRELTPEELAELATEEAYEKAILNPQNTL